VDVCVRRLLNIKKVMAAQIYILTSAESLRTHNAAHPANCYAGCVKTFIAFFTEKKSYEYKVAS
jgi:hypothetical protein